MIVTQDQLCIDENISRKDDGSNATIHQFRSARRGEESSDETPEDKEPQGEEKVGLPCSEIVLALESE